MRCEIEWSGGAAWDAHFAQVRRPTLLQSRAYAHAVCPASGQRPRNGVISIDGAAAGVVQTQEAAALGRALHAVILDRGPLWHEGFGQRAHVAAFFGRFCAEFPARLGRRRRVIPETAAAMAEGTLQAGDLARIAARPQYRTIWLDLTPSLEALRRGLRPKWRATLRRAETAGVEVDWDWSGRELPSLLADHHRDKAERGYPGPDAKTLAQIAAPFVPLGAAGVATARVRGQRAAAILILTHGRGATYQVGWVGPLGRTSGAGHLLLWQALGALKDRGIDDFDLGGLTEAEGLTRFKSGLGGEEVTLAGQYR